MLLKLRNPGWPPEGASGSPVSVLMPGHIAPEDGREQGKQGMKEEEKEGHYRRQQQQQSEEPCAFSLRGGLCKEA